MNQSNKFIEMMISYSALIIGVVGGIYLMNEAFHAGLYIGQHPEFLRGTKFVRSKMKRFDEKVVGYAFQKPPPQEPAKAEIKDVSTVQDAPIE